jgi:hypothetical protein
MKTISMLFAFIFVLTTAYPQSVVEDAEKLKKPVDCGVDQYDAFKNSAFDLKDDLLKSTKNHAQLSEDIAKYETGEKEKNAINLGGDLVKMRQLKNSMGDFDDRVSQLGNDGKSLAANVSKVRPITKVKQATDNTKTSTRAVDLSRELLKELKTNVDKDLEKLDKYMKEVEEE